MLALAGRGGSISPRAIGFSLASQLGELEAGGQRWPVVGLAARRAADLEALEAAVGWLSAHGRRVLVNARVRLSASLVAALTEIGATVQLELASVHNRVQQALLGEEALPVVRLLLHAQELRARGVAVGVRLGPLTVGWHEQIEPVRPLLRHIAAADLRCVSVWSRALRPQEKQALFGDGHPPEAEWLTPQLRQRMLEATVVREAAAAGLAVDPCGCSAACHLAAPLPAYVPVAAPELFPCAS